MPATRAERDAARKRQKRDKDRLRKAKQRERQAEVLRLAAIAEAARLEEDARRQERQAERLAPAVLRRPVMTHDAARGVVRRAGVAEEGAPLVFVETRPAEPPRMLVGARVAIVDGRPVRAFVLNNGDDPIVHLLRESKAITERHAAAARQLQLDWEDVGGGLNLGAVDYLRTGGGSGGGGDGINAGMLAQIHTRARLDGAMAHLGAYAPSVARIVLDCVPACVWGEQVGKSSAQAVAWLAAALDRLAGFYDPELVRVRFNGLLTFGPSRSAYSTAIEPNAPAAADADPAQQPA